MSLLSVDDVRLVIDTDLGDEGLQSLIDREESWLARRLGGPLVGKRTETFPFAGYRRRQYDVHLKRPTDTASLVEVTDNDEVMTDVIVIGDGWRIAAALGMSSFVGPVSVTYTPIDELEVVHAVVGLTRLALADGQLASGFKSETMGDYAYSLGDGPQSPAAIRTSLVRNLLEPRHAGTLGLRVPAYGRVTPVVEAPW